MLSSLAGPAEGSEAASASHAGSASAEAPLNADQHAAGENGDGGAGQQSGTAAAGDAVAAAAAVAGAQQQQKQETVPHGALHEARSEIKQLKATIARLEAQPRLTSEDQAALAKLRAADQATQQQEPDFLADPKGYVDNKVKAALEKLDAAEKKTEETHAKVAEGEQLRAVLQATMTAEQTFVQTTPDYPQALQHIRSVRTAQLQALYPEATAEQVANHIAYEERETARGLIAQNRNPAEFAYTIAKTLGYQPQKPQGQPANRQAPVDKAAVRTLGSGGGDAQATEDAGSGMPEFKAALAERFKKKR